jgi:hypothetical protein
MRLRLERARSRTAARLMASCRSRSLCLGGGHDRAEALPGRINCRLSLDAESLALAGRHEADDAASTGAIYESGASGAARARLR